MEKTVEEVKQYLAQKESDARDSAPEGMEFIGWIMAGWVVTYPPIDETSKPAYVFKSVE